MEESLTWQQLSLDQKTDIVLYCDQYEDIQVWEIEAAQYEVVGGQVFFADETEH